MSAHLSRTTIPLALAAGFLAFCPNSSAQAQRVSGAAPAAASKAQAAQPFVIESLLCGVRFYNEGRSVREDSARVRIQSAAGVDRWGLITFGYNSANQEAEVAYVRVRKPDGTVVSTPAADVQDVTDEVTRDAPVYSDYHQKQVPVKGLSPGDVLEYDYIVRTRTPLVPGEFWFQYDFNTINIVLNQQLEISVPKDRAVIVKSHAVQPAIVTDGSRKVYTWKTSNLKVTDYGELLPRAPPPAVELTSFENWQQVAQWWNSLEQPQMAPTPAIRAEAAELTQGAATDADKLKDIYNYVASQFRYISISFGIGRYEPHAAGMVLSNRYGDCKDKHTLFASLLDAVGIQAYPALMNTSRTIDPDVPSPTQFDHVISVIPLGKTLVWADTTTEVAPLGYLAPALRGRRALVIPPSQPASIMTTPAALPFSSFENVQIDGKIGIDGAIQCKVDRTVRGDAEVWLREDFRDTAKPDWKDVAPFVAYGTQYGGEVSNVSTMPAENTGAPFSYSYQLKQKDAVDWAYKHILLQAPVLGLPVLEETARPRKYPIQIGAPRQITISAKLVLPPGYTPKVLPPVKLSENFADYSSSYDFKAGALMMHRTLTVKTKQVPASGAAEYQSFVKAVGQDLLAYTYLYTSAESEAALPPNPAAAKLVEQARDAFQAGDLASAADLLEEAVKRDPQFERGWVALGSARFRLGQSDAALTAIRKAISLNPQDSLAHRMLAELLTASRSADAAQAWRDLLKLQPNDREAHATLGNLLFDQKKFGEAASQLDAAARLGSPSAPLEERVAEADVNAGDSAGAALEKAAQIDPAPANLNKVASQLADRALDLAAAQRYAETAVKTKEGQASKISLDHLKPSDVETAQDLGEFWATLGWV